MHKKIVEESLNEAKSARNQLSHKPGIIVGNLNPQNKGLYLSNYANCLLNRQIDIFDDTIFLVENNRIPAACAISRGMIETYAFSKLLSKKIAKVLNNKTGVESVDASLQLVMDFTNSSRFKESEQKKISKGIFDPNDYMFTEEAKYRFENMLAGSEHVMNALRDLYEDELKHTSEKESQFEITYDILSEWVHPSQTSVFHNYVPETHNVPTSMGDVHLYDAAKMSCARALHFIVDSMNVYNWTIELSDEITRRGKEYS
ncbi:MAG: hypothetical protein GYB15_02010 [Gammaproteobacteria bacterium]|nr:hypothetical protein [Gammaproteobacteria bacterium]